MPADTTHSLTSVAARRRALAGSFALALGISVVIVVVAWPTLPHLSTDSLHYIDLAEGRPQNVNAPFNTRVLHPALVRLLAAGGLSTDQAYLAWGVLALFTLAAAVALLLQAGGAAHPRATAAAVLLTPFLFELFRDYYLPDLFHAALLGLFFLIMLRAEVQVKYKLTGLLILFLLYLTRESALLLTAALVAVSLFRGDRRLAYAAAAVTLLAMLAASLAGRLGQPNVHAMNDLLYLGLKIPFNFSKNVLGLTPWFDTHAAINVSYCEPIATLAVPPWLPLGSIQRVGLCAWDPGRPLGTAALLLTVFGVAPTVVLTLLARRREWILRGSPAWLLAALAYGLLALIVGTSVGAEVGRLIGFGWPACLIAAPLLLTLHPPLGRAQWLQLLACHLLAAYAALIFLLAPGAPAWLIALVVAGALALHYLAFRALGRPAERLEPAPAG